MKRACKLAGTLLAALAVMLLLTAAGGEGKPLRRWTVEEAAFTESSKLLRNPNRGFFHLYGTLLDDETRDFQALVDGWLRHDKETALSLIEINLANYRDCPISAKGLANLEALLEALTKTDKQLVLRFLYDWSGNAQETEPDTLGRVLAHMRQLEPLLRAYSSRIFSLQGVFVGDCGEMHHSAYLSDEHVRTLIRQLEKVTDETTYLAVRTPVYWRKITNLSNPGGFSRKNTVLAVRLGLFNDGMLGSASDCGTYGTGTLAEKGPYAAWDRAEELAFQNTLCRLVPNGGEVTLDNPYNDLENAIRDLETMHVTYISRDHQAQVLSKWENTKAPAGGCFGGQDGITYLERRLGYRLVLREARLTWDRETLTVEADVQNVGFAPVYKQADAQVVLWDARSGQKLAYPVAQVVRSLAGGTDKEKTLTLQARVPLAELPEGDWRVYLDLTDRATGQRILFGNDQEPGKYGYRLGEACDGEEG